MRPHERHPRHKAYSFSIVLFFDMKTILHWARDKWILLVGLSVVAFALGLFVAYHFHFDSPGWG